MMQITHPARESQPLPPFDGEPLNKPPSILSLGVFGASAVFTALAIGSGEILFWPSLVLSVGPGVLWIAIFVVILQWFINIEIARYSLATGKTMGFGVARRAPLLAVVLLLAAILPWIWPGWVRAGGQLASGLTGLPEKYLSVGILAVCVLSLTLPRIIYPFVEKAQAVMLGLIFLGVAYLFVVVRASQGGFEEFSTPFLDFIGVEVALTDILQREDASYFALLSGVVFAGAGGILNLGYGYMVAERRYGRARERRRQTGIGREADSDASPQPDVPSNTRRNWRRWIATLRMEHAILFVAGNIASIIFLSAIFFMLLRGTSLETTGVTFLIDVYSRLETTFGWSTAAVFAIVGFLVFFTSALGILDVTSRIAADIANGLKWGRRLLGIDYFHIFVLVQGAVSAFLIFVDPRQPFWLLASSAVLNTAAMAIYSITIVWLNRRELAPAARAPFLVEATVFMTGLAFAGAFLWTLRKVFF